MIGAQMFKVGGIGFTWVQLISKLDVAFLIDGAVFLIEISMLARSRHYDQFHLKSH